jgi:hypothetical protein
MPQVLVVAHLFHDADARAEFLEGDQAGMVALEGRFHLGLQGGGLLFELVHLLSQPQVFLARQDQSRGVHLRGALEFAHDPLDAVVVALQGEGLEFGELGGDV